jgi:hypothetical protein
LGGRCFRHGLFLILESSSSSDFGRRPRRSSGFRLAATPYARDQWACMRQLPDAQKKAEEEDNDRRPKWETAPSTTKREWNASIALMKKKTTALTECDASAPFRVSEFPSCLLHAEADLKPKKAFKETTLRTNVAGACGLAFVRCGEMAFFALGRDSSVMSRLNAAISGDSSQDVESLQVLKDTRQRGLLHCRWVLRSGD